MNEAEKIDKQQGNGVLLCVTKRLFKIEYWYKWSTGPKFAEILAENEDDAKIKFWYQNQEIVW